MIEYLTGGAAIAFAATLSFGAGLYANRQRAGELSDADFQQFIQNINEGYYRSSLGGKQMFGNKALIELNGYDTEDEFLASVDDIATEWYVEPDRRGQFKKLLEDNGFVENFVSEIYRHKTRERIWISENARLVSDKAGRPLYYEGTVREFSETMKRLKLEELHHKLSERVPGALFQARKSADNSLSLPYFSGGLEKIIGEIPENVSSDARQLFKKMHPEDLEEFGAAVERAARKQVPLIHEFRIRPSPAREIWVEVNAAPELEADGSCVWSGILIDITDKKLNESRIHSLAFYDPLTQLPNRRMLVDRIKTTIERSAAAEEQSALLFVDLDGFKALNDSRGHGFGDKLLVETSKRLRSCVGDEGVTGRLAGDEFLVLLGDLGKDARIAAQTAEEMARRILGIIDAPCMVKKETIHPTCSIGIAMIDGQTKTTSEALKQSDTAMYVAKEAGKNCYRFFDPKMQAELESSTSLMTDFRQAIGTDQLALHYQTQVDGENNVVGAEGLLRWTHPTKGPVSPGQFIPFAEQNGMILLITDWLLLEAFETLQRWSEIPTLCDVRLSINISAQQFHQESFVGQVQVLTERFDVRPELLILEMTEHVLTGDLRKVKNVMSGLRALGVGFSLDDFGTGYSSLTHMRDLPFDEVKIDGKFVCDLEKNESDKAIVRSIIAMAHTLGMKTVAEWVESDPQREFLAREGCDALQGFLFGPAVPLTVFEEMAQLPLLKKDVQKLQPDYRMVVNG